MRPELQPVAGDPAHAAILLDFDGTLSDIVARPELASPVPGAREALGVLAARYSMVGVISGRPTEEVAALVGVAGLRYAGHYGAEQGGDPIPSAVREGVIAAAERVQGAWVEDKGSSLAVHYRQAPDRTSARETLAGPLGTLAIPNGLEVIEGKMVLELVPRSRPRKGAAVERLVRESGARAVLFAGDDLADLEAFAALDRLRTGGVAAVKVGIHAGETPTELEAAADLVVDGPAGLVGLLRELTDA